MEGFFYIQHWSVTILTAANAIHHPKNGTFIVLLKRVWIQNVTFYCQISRQDTLKLDH